MLVFLTMPFDDSVGVCIHMWQISMSVSVRLISFQTCLIFSPEACEVHPSRPRLFAGSWRPDRLHHDANQFLLARIAHAPNHTLTLV